MKTLFVHPGPLLYTNVFLRLEPLGLELVAEAARRARHSVRLVDLQVESHADYHRMIAEWQPDFIARATALHTLIHRRHLTPSCGGHALTAEGTLHRQGC
jgi:hypothetical protein